MRVKLTSNGYSRQFVIPAIEVRRYGFKDVDEVDVDVRGDGLLVKPADFLCFDIWTVGYEGLGIDVFVQRLKDAGIKQLADVRELAFSRKNGFSKNALSSALGSAGIMYAHFPELGSPSNTRHEFKSGGSWDEFLIEYKRHLATQSEAFDFLVEFTMANRTALMCYERDPSTCHRSIIAERMAGIGFKVNHL